MLRMLQYVLFVSANRHPPPLLGGEGRGGGGGQCHRKSEVHRIFKGLNLAVRYSVGLLRQKRKHCSTQCVKLGVLFLKKAPRTIFICY